MTTEKLTLEHLAPYLAYGLKMINKANYEQTGMANILELCSLVCNNSMYVRELGSKQRIEYHLPILRPLSDLTKEIEHNGEKFIPCQKIIDLTSYGDSYKKQIFWKVINASIKTKFISFKSNVSNEFEIDLVHSGNNKCWINSHLLKWHFDVFGLIDKKLAIDINTLND
jgi:hypothetical protein